MIATSAEFRFLTVMSNAENNSQKPELGSVWDEKQPIFFGDWSEVLAAENLPADVCEARKAVIIRFLKFCKRERAPVTITMIKAYLEAIRVQGKPVAEARLALRWFVLEARKRGAAGSTQQPTFNTQLSVGSEARGSEGTGRGDHGRSMAGIRGNNKEEGRALPSRGAEGLDGPEWEQALVRAVRAEHLLWRTEETYRGWAWRFVEFIRPKGPRLADKDDVRAFLEDLAVRQRVAPATQKQALNAVVFLMKKGLGIEVGDFSDFQRAAPFRRVPTVLSTGELRRLFAEMDGTTRLMAELTYGSGLRVTEMLRLRIKDVDLERGTVAVHGGKGDKDRMTVLPESLHERLREQIGELRGIWARDRRDGVPGVWLEEGLERKFKNAGEQWVWQWLFPSRELSVDPQTGVRRRHHLSDTAFQKTIKRAARRAKIDKRVTPHVLRHSFATHVLESGTDIRTLQDLMGHADVRTTQIYLHVMKKPGIGVRSPLDPPSSR